MIAVPLFAVAFGVTTPVTNLPPIIVEATRIGSSVSEVPARVEIISQEDVRNAAVAHTTDLLEKRANLFFRHANANPVQAQVSMRGYGANGFGRVKVLVDGEELNNPDMAAQDWLRVPVESVSRIEILHGPQTILHGSSASAGVINILSLPDSYDRHTTLEVHGGSWETFGAHAGTTGGDAEEDIRYYADADWEHSDGWRENSGWNLYSAKGGVTKHWDGGQSFGIRTFYSDSHYGLPGGLYDGMVYGVNYGRWQDHARDAYDTDSEAHDIVYGLRLSGGLESSDERKLESSAGFRSRTSHAYSDYDVYTYDATLKYTDEHRLFGFNNRFICGTDWKYDDLSVSGATAKNLYDRLTAALFAEDIFDIVEDTLSLTTGVRAEGQHARVKYRPYSAARDISSDRTGRFAGEVGLDYRPIEDLKLFSRWTSFYHAPLADEMFSSYGVPNTDLDPEIGQSVEVGSDWQVLPNWHWEGTLFYTRLDDEIMYLNSANVNAPDETCREGFETSFGWAREKIGSAKILYSYTETRFLQGEYKDEYIPLVPRQLLRLFGDFYLRDDFAVEGGFRFVGQQRYGGDVVGAGGMMPDYCLFDCAVRYQPTFNLFKGFTFSLAIDNLFDRRYTDYGEWFGAHYVYPAAGRSFRVSIRYEF